MSLGMTFSPTVAEEGGGKLQTLTIVYIQSWLLGSVQAFSGFFFGLGWLRGGGYMGGYFLGGISHGGSEIQ